jgi:thioesterase domain-containing protein
MTPQAFTEFLHENIPLTGLAGIYVAQTEPRRIEIRAPMALNRNHHGTVFGGSLAMIAIVTGWSVLHRALIEEGLNVKLVIGKSESDFVAPGIGEVVAVSELTDPEWRPFADAVRDRGRGRIMVETRISTNGVLVVAHRGVFAARPPILAAE